MSDPPLLAQRLEAKFGYTNTYYHQAPTFDVTRPDAADTGRYDFIVSSEVMEHVPPPVEQSFANLCRMLQPDGFLLLTVPYRLEGPTQEHFPDLHQFTLAAPGGKTVLLNRLEDGSLQVFEDLCFHGGHGSTLEMRVFSEPSLKQTLLNAGFSEVHIAYKDVPEFGVSHAETWSLPIVARKGPFAPPALDLARAYRDACLKTTRLESNLRALQAEFTCYREHAEKVQANLSAELSERVDWVRKVEADFEERTNWALSLQKEVEEGRSEIVRLSAAESEAWRRLADAERELGEAKAARAALEARSWTRLGRKLRLS
jgi:SAM-dependent methyltransferase